MATYGLREQVSHRAGVTEGVNASGIHAVEDLGEHLFRRSVQGIFHFLIVSEEQHTEDLLQLASVVVQEFDGHVAAGRDAGILAHELVHLLGITRHDANEFATPVLQQGKQRIDGVHAETAAVAGRGTLGECIGLIDEKHAADGLVDITLHVRLRVPDHLPDEILGGHFHELSRGQGADRAEHFAELAGESGLAGPRIAGEEIVVREQAIGLHTIFLAGLHIPDNFENLILDALQADVVFQFSQDFLF